MRKSLSSEREFWKHFNKDVIWKLKIAEKNLSIYHTLSTFNDFFSLKFGMVLKEYVNTVKNVSVYYRTAETRSLLYTPINVHQN